MLSYSVGKFIMIKIFDYLFFRVYAYYKKKYSHLADVYAESIVSGLQFLLVMNFLIVVNFIMIKYFDIAIFSKATKKAIFIPMIFALYFLNNIRYKKQVNFNKLESLWGSESKIEKTKRFWLLVLFFISATGLMVILGSFLR
jgi:hypothetical protein